MTVKTTKQLRLRRGNTAEHANFIGAAGQHGTGGLGGGATGP